MSSSYTKSYLNIFDPNFISSTYWLADYSMGNIIIYKKKRDIASNF